jgi:outer membrane murein-binding lipoprotein Lpp
LTWLIVIVVVVLVVAAIIALTGKRRSEGRRQRAEELRSEASTHAAGLAESQRQAEELRAKADLARSEAARVEERAADAEQGHRIEQASYEDKLREADRLDPAVDHKADDYEPDVWSDERTDSETTPRHAASPEAATAAERTDVPESESTTGTTGTTERTDVPESETTSTTSTTERRQETS